MVINNFLLNEVLKEKEQRLFTQRRLMSKNPTPKVNTILPDKRLPLYSWFLYIGQERFHS